VADVTHVAALYRAAGTPSHEEVRTLTAAEAEALVADLPDGSTRPKLESCVAFVRSTGTSALIASGAVLPDRLRGRAGTTVLP
jgi:carbamate kinase